MLPQIPTLLLQRLKQLKMQFEVPLHNTVWQFEEKAPYNRFRKTEPTLRLRCNRVVFSQFFLKIINQTCDGNAIRFIKKLNTLEATVHKVNYESAYLRD